MICHTEKEKETANTLISMTEIQNDIDKNKLMLLALAAKVVEIPAATETKDMSIVNKNVPKVTQESESESSDAIISDLSASLACCEVKESKETPSYPQSLSF